MPQQTPRTPLGTWYRFRLAAEQARTALVFLTQSPCASSCASLALRCEPGEAVPFSGHGETPLFDRHQYRLARERNRNEGKASATRELDKFLDIAKGTHRAPEAPPGANLPSKELIDIRALMQQRSLC